MDDGDLGLTVLVTQSEMKMLVFSPVYGNLAIKKINVHVQTDGIGQGERLMRDIM